MSSFQSQEAQGHLGAGTTHLSRTIHEHGLNPFFVCGVTECGIHIPHQYGNDARSRDNPIQSRDPPIATIIILKCSSCDDIALNDRNSTCIDFVTAKVRTLGCLAPDPLQSLLSSEL